MINKKTNVKKVYPNSAHLLILLNKTKTLVEKKANLPTILITVTEQSVKHISENVTENI